MPVLLILLGIALLLGLMALPSWWVRRVMKRYHQPEDLFEDNGGSLARYLLDQHDLKTVGVEACEPGQDHYDPTARMVRLSPENLQGRSLTAITVAAHEVGHALQHAQGSELFASRIRLVAVASGVQRIAAVALFGLPIIALLSRSPGLSLLVLIVALSGMLMSSLVHLVTLPVEWDASFGRALPMLRSLEILPDTYQPHARRILKAAALTYVAASIASLLNLTRWLAVLRR